MAGDVHQELRERKREGERERARVGYLLPYEM